MVLLDSLVRARSMTRAAAWCSLALSLTPRLALAQATDFSIPAGTGMPNYDRVSIGQREGLEANAFVARTDDAGANWYNPAGLVLSEKSALNASANAYEFNGVALVGLEFAKGGTRFTSIGSFFGGVVGAPIVHSRNLRLGFSFTKPVSWAPSQIEGEIHNASPGGDESFLYSSSINMSTVVPALNAGLRLGERVRVGAGVGYAQTSLHQNQSISDRLLSGASATTLLRSFETDGHVGGLLLTGGVQVDLGSRLTLGAQVTSPAIRLSGSSRITYQNTSFSGAVSRDIAFRDGEAKFDYQVPLRATIGAAFRFGKGEVEVDLRYHGSREAYPFFSSTVPATLVTTDAAGVPTVGSLTFTDVVEETKAVYNIAVGGHYAFSPSFRLHAGFFTDDSPVANSDKSVFRAIDLVGASGGVSFGAGHLTASVGVSGSSGTSDPRQVGPSLGGIEGSTRFKVKTFNILYAISYAF
jgi:hypothetical protein